jgi:serine/threonine-protein kinase
VWITHHAWNVTTAAEARDALAALPAFEPLGYPKWHSGGAVGRVQFLAGKLDDAVTTLRRSARECDGLNGVNGQIHWIQDRGFYGQALEAKGDVAGACAEYAFVLARWGRAKPRSKTADLVRDRAKALKCETK